MKFLSDVIKSGKKIAKTYLKRSIIGLNARNCIKSW
jgi:hypothetical protein